MLRPRLVSHLLLHCLILHHVGKGHCQLNASRLYLRIVFLILVLLGSLAKGTQHTEGCAHTNDVPSISSAVDTILVSTPPTQAKKRKKSFKRRTLMPELSKELASLSDLTLFPKRIVAEADVHIGVSPCPHKSTESEVSVAHNKHCRSSADWSE